MAFPTRLRKNKKTVEGYGIPCPRCGHPFHKVVDTTDERGMIIRRRKCLGCLKNFHTREESLWKPQAPGQAASGPKLSQLFPESYDADYPNRPLG